MNCQLNLKSGAMIWALASSVGTDENEVERIKDGEVSAERIEAIKQNLREAAFVLSAVIPMGRA